MDPTHLISALPYLKFWITKWPFDSTIDFVLLALTFNPYLAHYPCSLSKHLCNPSLDVDISNKSSAHDILLNEMFSNTGMIYSPALIARWWLIDAGITHILIHGHNCLNTGMIYSPALIARWWLIDTGITHILIHGHNCLNTGIIYSPAVVVVVAAAAAVVPPTEYRQWKTK